MLLPKPHHLRRLFYVSHTHATPVDVERILYRARCRNALHGVTGMLIYTGGHFAQVLEGTLEALARTMSAITTDPRHGRMRRLVEGGIGQRSFEGRSMALLEAPRADRLLRDLLDAPAVPREHAERALRQVMFETAAN